MLVVVVVLEREERGNFLSVLSESLMFTFSSQFSQTELNWYATIYNMSERYL